MEQQQLVVNVMNAAAEILRHVEAAQALAARQVQEWNKLGGADFFTDFNWETVHVTSAQISTAVSTLSTAFPDILGAHGTNLYLVKG